MSLLSKTHPIDDDLPELTPEQLAELDDLDAILAGEPANDDVLAALVRDVRTAAPEMRLEATERLTGRVAAGFGRGGARRRVWRGSAMLSPLGATACVLLVMGGVGGVVVAGEGRSGDDSETVSMAEPAAAPSSSSPSGDDVERSFERGAIAEGGAPTTTSGSGGSSTALSDLVTPQRSTASTPSEAAEELAPKLRNATGLLDGASRGSARSVERSVDLAVRVTAGKLEEATGKVGSITRDANGYVASSDLSVGTAGRGTATFELRVDSSKLDRAVDRLSDLGTVTSQNERSRDITSAVDSAQSRLDDATAERQALLRSLAKAGTAGEIASLRTRIAENRRLRASLDTQLKQVQRRADLTTIDLTLRSPVDDDPTTDDGRWSIGDAASDAGSVLTAIAGALLVGGAVLLPFALLGGLGWLAYAWRRRRARERALDA
ncbi:MAG: DUF4349 domain-containing protein [Patulibacter minatonensis]